MKLNIHFKEFVQALEASEVKYVIVGAHAYSIYARPRFTEDFDVFVEPSVGNAARVMNALRIFGMASAVQSPDDFAKPHMIATFGIEPHRIDVLTGINGVTFEEVWETRRRIEIEGMGAWLISLEMLIKNKMATGRAKDMADVENLQKAANK